MPTKLTPETAVEICERYADGASCDELSADYGVSKATIYNVLAGRSWADATADIRRDWPADNRIRGADQHMAKLTAEDALAIRRRRAEGETMARLAGEYGVAKRTIYMVDKRLTWAHI